MFSLYCSQTCFNDHVDVNYCADSPFLPPHPTAIRAEGSFCVSLLGGERRGRGVIAAAANCMSDYFPPLKPEAARRRKGSRRRRHRRLHHHHRRRTSARRGRQSLHGRPRERKYGNARAFAGEHKCRNNRRGHSDRQREWFDLDGRTRTR